MLPNVTLLECADQVNAQIPQGGSSPVARMSAATSGLGLSACCIPDVAALIRATTHSGALKHALIAYLYCDKLRQSPSEKPTGCRCEPMANSDHPTIIEKYANRRLYNTGTYTLVTLDELAAMLKRGRDFLVYDAQTGVDITRSVLAQIVFERENTHGAR
jgi:PHB/PHA accumulation regulator DNA-binding domain